MNEDSLQNVLLSCIMELDKDTLKQLIELQEEVLLSNERQRVLAGIRSGRNDRGFCSHRDFRHYNNDRKSSMMP